MPSTQTSISHKKSRTTRPKLFQCTGFGSCQMVFTRSEHLARHTRKHTGEKPFLCVVPDCTRRFSRFDNMMQHTQTHKTTRSKSPSEAHTTHSIFMTTPTTQNFPTLIPSTSTSSSISYYEPEDTPEFVTHNSHSSFVSCGDSSDEESTTSGSFSPISNSMRKRKMSVNELCHHQPPPPLKELHLTQDEFEALQGFGRFKHTPILIDSFRDLASVVYIEPNPVRTYTKPY